MLLVLEPPHHVLLALVLDLRQSKVLLQLVLVAAASSSSELSSPEDAAKKLAADTLRRLRWLASIAHGIKTASLTPGLYMEKVLIVLPVACESKRHTAENIKKCGLPRRWKTSA